MSKKKRSGGMSNSAIDEWYELGRANGAIGGKVVGRGRGRLPALLRGGPGPAAEKPWQGAGLDEVRFRFDFEGTKVLLS